MRAFASSFHAWKSLERTEGVKVPHGLTFPLAILEAIGRAFGLTLVAEEESTGPSGCDAIFLSVLDSRCMMDAAKHFRAWRIPFRRRDRNESHPLVWAGGQGLHNPLPLANVFDLCVIGDAEGPLPKLLALHAEHGNSSSFLRHAADVPGVFVPAHHDRRDVIIEQSVAQDVSITLREEIMVNLNGTRRIEIARGCQYKCTFCSLGWRTPVRENSAEQVIATIVKSPKVVHLQAGDAESHSGITEIRRALKAHGGRDNGWTGRLDTLLDNPDTVGSNKKYAFGVEGVSHRLRRAVGKGYLTDERLIADTCTFFDSIDGDAKGRGAWHVIAGLPTERKEEALDLARVIRSINDRRRGKTARNLTLHWQPFSPLPGTPMQWCAGGKGARHMIALLKAAEGLPWVPVRQFGGRTDDMAQLCTVLSRADERGANMLEAMADRRLSVDDAERITGSIVGALDPREPLPWDFIKTEHDKSVLRKAYDVMIARLHE